MPVAAIHMTLTLPCAYTRWDQATGHIKRQIRAIHGPGTIVAATTRSLAIWKMPSYDLYRADMHAGPFAGERNMKSWKTVAWAFLLPAAALGLGRFTNGLSLALLLLYPLNVARIAMRLRRDGEPRPWTVATFLMLSKFPEGLGWLRYQVGRITGRRSRIIEYKTP